MRRNLINNYRFLDFPQETSIEIKQGDFTPITVKLDSTETIKDDGKDAKVILINTDNEKVFETSVPANNRIVEFAINKNLPKGRYFLEIVYNQMKFPSRDYKTIIINSSASLGDLKEINIISVDDVKNRFISEAKKELTADIDRLVSEKLKKYVTENQEALRGQSVSITNHEFDENGNLNITFSDETSIQIPKSKDGTNGVDGNDGKDGYSVTTITERGVSNDRNGVFVRTYRVDHEGIKQDLISETFVSDGKDGSDGKPFTYDDFTEQQLISLKGKDGKPFTPSDLTEEDFKKILDYGIENGYFKNSMTDNNPIDTSNIVFSDVPPLDITKLWINIGGK